MNQNLHISPKNRLVQYDDFWETFGKSRRDLHWPEIDDLLEDFLQGFTPKSGSIADIGCGNGRLIQHILKHPQNAVYQSLFSTYVGLDTSEVLLDQARDEPAFSGFLPSVNWREGDMRDMEKHLSEYGLFDGIFFIASFHHLATEEERIGVLRQAQKLLSDTGKIAMINWNLLDPSQTRYEPSKIADHPDGSADFEIKIWTHTRFYHSFSSREYHSLSEKTGLRIVRESFFARNSVIIFQ